MPELQTTVPDFALDVERFRPAILERLSTARFSEAPFPHVIVDDLWPDELRQAAVDMWPPAEAFFTNKSAKKVNLELAESPNKDAGHFELVPRDIQRFWQFISQQINGAIIGPWLAERFAADITERFELLSAWQAEGHVLPFDATGIPSRRWWATPGRLMLRGGGMHLAPHCDSAYFLVTALYYMGGGDESHGTVLCQAERPMPIGTFVGDGKTTYFHEHDIPVHEVVAVPFLPNRFVAFPNRPDAAHCVTAPKDMYRKVLQFHLSLSEPRATDSY